MSSTGLLFIKMPSNVRIQCLFNIFTSEYLVILLMVSPYWPCLALLSGAFELLDIPLNVLKYIAMLFLA